MSKLDPVKGGRTSCIQNRHQKRFIDGGKLCYGCNKVREYKSMQVLLPEKRESAVEKTKSTVMVRRKQ